MQHRTPETTNGFETFVMNILKEPEEYIRASQTELSTEKVQEIIAFLAEQEKNFSSLSFYEQVHFIFITGTMTLYFHHHPLDTRESFFYQKMGSACKRFCLEQACEDIYKAKLNYLLARIYFSIQQSYKAIKHCQKALAFEQVYSEGLSSKRSIKYALLYAMACYQRARVFTQRQESEVALELYQLALETIKEHLDEKKGSYLSLAQKKQMFFLQTQSSYYAGSLSYQSEEYMAAAHSLTASIHFLSEGLKIGLLDAHQETLVLNHLFNSLVCLIPLSKQSLISNEEGNVIRAELLSLKKILSVNYKEYSSFEKLTQKIEECIQVLPVALTTYPPLGLFNSKENESFFKKNTPTSQPLVSIENTN